MLTKNGILSQIINKQALRKVCLPTYNFGFHRKFSLFLRLTWYCGALNFEGSNRIAGLLRLQTLAQRLRRFHQRRQLLL